jgi:hypothetical protein
MRALNAPKIRGYEFVWAETVFAQVVFAVAPMFREVSATDDATVIATNLTPDEIDTFYAVQLASTELYVTTCSNR